MVWDDEKKEWRGNHADLLPFSSDQGLAQTTNTPMGRITNYTALHGSYQPIVDKSGMKFDPVTLKWISQSEDPSDDVFAQESPRTPTSGPPGSTSPFQSPDSQHTVIGKIPILFLACFVYLPIFLQMLRLSGVNLQFHQRIYKNYTK